jgi:two-component system response regulator YesN
MEHAAGALAAGKKVYQVAASVGYLSPKHFSQVFKQYYGETPGQWQGRGEV